MKPKGYVFLSRAAKELTEKASYLDENASEETTLRLIRAAFATASFLVDFPLIGTKCIIPDRKRTLRRFPVGGFPNVYLFYTSDTRGIRVTRILDARQDWPRFFQ